MWDRTGPAGQRLSLSRKNTVTLCHFYHACCADADLVVVQFWHNIKSM